MAAAACARDIRDFVAATCADAVERYFASGRIPRTFAGFRITDDFAVDLIYTLKYLHAQGVRELRGRDVGEIIRGVLKQVDGEKTETFYSYRIAETICAFGGFEGDLLRGFSAAERANLVNAVDSTHIYNEWGKPLGGRPNNYWAVLARCEYARKQLGVLPDEGMLNEAIEKTRAILFGNPAGFFDDSRGLTGRFDLYTADVHLFLEPMWHLFEAEKLRHNMLAHARLLESIALTSGMSIAWGRSIGLLSVCMTVELGALCLREKLASDEARMLGLVRNGFEKAKGWFEESLTNAHRYRMTDGYRGPHRMLQMTFDCLGKLAYAAEILEEVEDAGEAEARPEGLFPARDEWIELGRAQESQRVAGVWMFRNGVMEFQLPVVDAVRADYVPWLHAPGLFENPVDSQILCGVPRIWAGERGESVLGTGGPKWESEYGGGGLPVSVEKVANGLVLKYAGFPRSVGKEGPAVLGGEREVRYAVRGDTVEIVERFRLEAGGPGVSAVSYCVPEVKARPLHVRFSCTVAHEASVVRVGGMTAYLSATGEVERLHQVDMEPVEAGRWVELRVEIMPAVRVAHGPVDHDYNRALYDHAPAVVLKEIGFFNGNCAHRDMRAAKLFGDAEVVHIGWPEHLFGAHGMKEEEFDARWAGFVEELGRSGKKVVWTMHNRRPHGMVKERGVAMYRAFAPVVDACLHHSEWGKALMVEEMPFKEGCRHYVLPHMHFGRSMKTASRAVLEKKFGLKPCGVRLGLLGRYQKEKQIEMILEAFAEASRGREDLQLVMTTYREGVELPACERVVKLPRNAWMTREEIAEHTAVCDVLVSAHTGDTYLTSGLVGDAVGLGLTMLVPEWEFFREIMGEGAMYHGNTPASLTAAIAGLTEERVRVAKAKSAALQGAYDPVVLGARLAGILREVRLGG